MVSPQGRKESGKVLQSKLYLYQEFSGNDLGTIIGISKGRREAPLFCP